ncbi:DEAD/DEAH box helicase [Leadbetterella sp. DM7]|uniref:DEAD/DEAH box helicase n=1 Tax=Leadbetterella sp. DM7 TaxID=3235085 RepID=UPI00349EF22A
MQFADLNLNKPLLRALEDLELTTPTSIQEKIFPAVMSGKDLAGIARTGTGKTFAYLLPLLRMWTFSKEKLPQMLVLVPTRELVMQVVESVKALTPYMSFDVTGVYGGVNMKTQAAELLKGCDMVVATPGRFTDLSAAGVLKVKNIRKLVIDEFDMMLDLGFRPQLDLIFNKIPEKRQNLLFSATISEEVEELIHDIFKSPEVIEDADVGTPLENIRQKTYAVPNFRTKINLLELLLANDGEMKKNLVFVAQKPAADLLYRELTERGIEQVEVIHSNKSQNYRFRAIREFSEGTVRTLISTDIGSRGLDIKGITHVVNMDIPEERNDYIHRIGRTGRGESSGTAISLISPREEEAFAEIEAMYRLQLTRLPLPAYIETEDQLMPFETEKEEVKLPVVRHDRSVGPAFHEKLEKNKKINKRRDIQAEKKLKYGKAYRKNM